MTKCADTSEAIKARCEKARARRTTVKSVPGFQKSGHSRDPPSTIWRKTWRFCRERWCRASEKEPNAERAADQVSRAGCLENRGLNATRLSAYAGSGACSEEVDAFGA